VDSPAPFSQEQPPLITTTVQEYDTSQLKSAVKNTFMGIGMMGVMHLYFGYTQPLLVQSIMPIKTAFESKVVKIHLLGSDPVGDLKRPWKTGGLFAGAGADVSSLVNGANNRDPRQIKRLLRKLRSVLERQSWSRL
jgi:Phosphate transport (Pho88)